MIFIERNYKSIILPGLLLLVGILAFWHFYRYIDHSPMWLDECASAWFSTHSFSEVLDIMERDNSPPLYPLLLKAIASKFGYSPAAMRMLSVLCMSISVCIVFFTFARKRNWFWLGITMATLFALSNEVIVYAHEARAYALLTFFGLGLMLSLKLLIERWTWIRLGSMIIFSAGLLYTHYLGFYLVAISSVLCLISLGRERRKPFLFAYFPSVFVLVLPWMVQALSNVASRATTETYIQDPLWKNIKWVFRCFYNGEPLSWLIPTSILLGFLLFLILKKDLRKLTFGIAVLVLWLAYYGHSLFLSSIYIPRYLMLILALSILAFGEFIQYTVGRSRWLLIFYAFCIFGIQKYSRADSGTYEEWDLIEEKRTEFRARSEVLFSVAPWTYMPYSYHFDKACFEQGKGTVDCLSEKGEHFYWSEEQFDAVIQEKEPGSIFYFGYQDQAFKMLKADYFVAKGYNKIDSFSTTHFNFAVWSKSESKMMPGGLGSPL